MGSDGELRARVENLENMGVPPARNSGKTLGDLVEELGFSEAECRRLVEFCDVARRSDRPLDLEHIDEHHSDALAAAEGARWLHCRMEHGPGLCDVDCPGKFLHRPQWQPSKAPIRW